MKVLVKEDNQENIDEEILEEGQVSKDDLKDFKEIDVFKI